ncbi:hypothetical protein BC830DRAFT_1077927 [Chytriomyces sp. MP71]|nr:hypothetical protein BC830DRAFT_1077927 [Chytriomyces sp. MP71]
MSTDQRSASSSNSVLPVSDGSGGLPTVSAIPSPPAEGNPTQDQDSAAMPSPVSPQSNANKEQDSDQSHSSPSLTHGNSQRGSEIDRQGSGSRRRYNHKLNHPNRASSLSTDSGDPGAGGAPPKLYLAGPFQADPATYNAAAAAAAAAIASAPQSVVENTSPIVNSAAMQQTYMSPNVAPRPPYYVYQSGYFPPGPNPSNPIAPNQDQSAFFSSPTAVPAPNNLQFGPQPPWIYANFPSRPHSGIMASPSSGGRGNNANKKAYQRNSANSFFSPPPQSASMLPMAVGKSPEFRQQPFYPHNGRNFSESNVGQASLGRASTESLNNVGSPSYYPTPQYQQRSNKRESNNNVAAPAATGSDAGDSAGSGGCTTNLFGRIYSSKAILDLVTQECKGFGFVMYETEEETKVAFDGLVAQGYQVSYARTDPRSPSKDTFVNRLKSLHDESSTNIYISNLPISLDEDGLIELLKPRQVVSAKILRDPVTQKSRGVGFARLETRDEAISTIQELHGKLLPDSFQHLQARFADSVAQKRFKSTSHQQFGHGFPGMSPMMMAGPYMSGGPAPAADGEEAGMPSMSPSGVSDGSAPETPAQVYYDPYTASGAPTPYMYAPGMYYSPQHMYYAGTQFYPAPMPPTPEAASYENQQQVAEGKEVNDLAEDVANVTV